MQTPTFNQLLSRADDQTLQHLVGSPAVRLLNALDPQLATPANLRSTCLRLHTPATLLTEPQLRSRLLAILRPEHALALATRLGLASDNPYDTLQRLQIRTNSARHRHLLSFFGVVPPAQVTAPTPDSISTTAPEYRLFDHQRRALREAVDALRSPPRRVLLHMPTGAGKTRTALHLVSSELRQREPTIVVWLAYSEELCDQAATEFERAWSYLGDRPVSLYRFWGSHHDIGIQDVRDGFVVAGLAKTFERAKRDAEFIARLADRTALVVIDEAHQAIAATYSFVLDYLVSRNDQTGLIGLTATPGRTWNDPSVDTALSDFFGRNKVTLRVRGYPNPVDYLIANGYLARPTFRRLRYGNHQPITERQLRLLASSLDIPESVLRTLADDEKRNLVIVSAVEDLIRRHRRILLFAATVEHARLLAVVLQARGVDASAITATTPRHERSLIIAAYKNDDARPTVLCNYGVLTTGIDAPRTSAAVIARPTKSLVLYSQMVGRATRGPRVGGNDEAEIITIVDTRLPGFGDIATAFENWEDVWNARTI